VNIAIKNVKVTINTSVIIIIPMDNPAIGAGLRFKWSGCPFLVVASLFPEGIVFAHTR
jgi:hypothetical protein